METVVVGCGLGDQRELGRRYRLHDQLEALGVDIAGLAGSIQILTQSIQQRKPLMGQGNRLLGFGGCGDFPVQKSLGGARRILGPNSGQVQFRVTDR